MTDISANVSAALAATAGEDPQIRAAAAGGAASAVVPPPPAQDVGWLWRALTVGLIAIMVIALAGIIFMLADGNDKTSPDVLVTIFASVLTGLIGLFVKSPSSS